MPNLVLIGTVDRLRAKIVRCLTVGLQQMLTGAVIWTFLNFREIRSRVYGWLPSSGRLTTVAPKLTPTGAVKMSKVVRS